MVAILHCLRKGSLNYIVNYVCQLSLDGVAMETPQVVKQSVHVANENDVYNGATSWCHTYAPTPHVSNW